MMLCNKASQWLVVVMVGLAATAASAQLLETRSNYMGSDWSASWSAVSNWWTKVTPYPSEPNDGGADIEFIGMAHDDTYLYIYFSQTTAFDYDPNNEYIFFDTDLNPATGNTTDFWWWGQSTGGVGAEHTMYGAAIFHAAIGYFNNDWVDNWNYSGGKNILIQINRAQLGNPSSFNWTARFFGTDDYYPNAGSWHRYEFTNSPPPCMAGFSRFDKNQDGYVDMLDFAEFQLCSSGPGILADPSCGW